MFEQIRRVYRIPATHITKQEEAGRVMGIFVAAALKHYNGARRNGTSPDQAKSSSAAASIEHAARLVSVPDAQSRIYEALEATGTR